MADIKTALQIRDRGQITLPADLRKKANLQVGDWLEVSLEQDGTLRLIPKLFVDRPQSTSKKEDSKESRK